MKKQSSAGFCVIIILVISVNFSFAQDAATQFGVKAGLNLANISFDPEIIIPSYDAVTKFGLGVFMLHPFSEVLDLQIEAMYLQKGTKLEENFGETKWNLSYLSIPVLGRYKFGSENASTYVFAGPEIGFLLSAKIEYFRGEGDIKDNIKSMDIGLNVGAGVSRLRGMHQMLHPEFTSTVFKPAISSRRGRCCF